MKKDHSTNRTELARHGDISFDFIYYRYYRPLYFFSLELLHDEAEAQDLVADTFVKYYERMDQFSQEHQIKAFLYKTTRNAAFNALRNRKIRNAKIPAIQEEWSASDSTFFDKLVFAELMRQIAEEVERLPEMQRNVFILSYFDGKPTAEIAQLLAISIESVYNNRKRAVDKLKGVFQTRDLPIYLAFIQLFFTR